MNSDKPYRVKEFNLSDLTGISESALDMHFQLYKGYVKKTNGLMEKISEYFKNGKVDKGDMLAYSELKRCLAFEYNGMELHEYYFGNLKKDGGGDPDRKSAFCKAVESNFGSYEIWKADFTSLGKTRGVGWAICYQDPMQERLSNHWITLNQIGNVAGFNPVLVLDVWEHAFLLDYKPSERPKYIEAFFSNIDWETVERRLQQVKNERALVAGR